MDNIAQFSSVARRVLHLVDAAVSLSKDEELLNLLRLYGSDPVPDLDTQIPRPSLAGPSIRRSLRRKRNANPCTKCVASRQACRYVNDDPLKCSNCIENNYDCVIRERKRPKPVLAIDMDAITAPRMSRGISSNQAANSLSSGIPESATSIPELSMNMVPPASRLDPHNVYSPSYMLGVQSSNLLLPNFENQPFLSQTLAGDLPAKIYQNAPQRTSSDDLRLFFPHDGLRNDGLGPGPSQQQGLQDFEYPFSQLKS